MTIKQIDIAAHLDLTPTAVSDFVRANKLDLSQMTIDDVRLFYIRKLRDRAMYRAVDDDSFDGVKEKARLLHNQANKAELEVKILKEDLIPKDQVVARWSDRVASARAKLLSIPTRLASACVGKSEREIEATARSIVHEALDELRVKNGSY